MHRISSPKTLGESLSDKQMIFLIDTIDASKLKELPSSWKAPLSKLLDSPHANVRMRTVELIRSRDVPGFEQQIDEDRQRQQGARSIARDCARGIGGAASAVDE